MNTAICLLSMMLSWRQPSFGPQAVDDSIESSVVSISASTPGQNGRYCNGLIISVNERDIFIVSEGTDIVGKQTVGVSFLDSSTKRSTRAVTAKVIASGGEAYGDLCLLRVDRRAAPPNSRAIRLQLEFAHEPDAVVAIAVTWAHGGGKEKGSLRHSQASHYSFEGDSLNVDPGTPLVAEGKAVAMVLPHPRTETDRIPAVGANVLAEFAITNGIVDVLNGSLVGISSKADPGVIRGHGLVVGFSADRGTVWVAAPRSLANQASNTCIVLGDRTIQPVSFLEGAAGRAGCGLLELRTTLPDANEIGLSVSGEVSPGDTVQVYLPGAGVSGGLFTCTVSPLPASAEAVDITGLSLSDKVLGCPVLFQGRVVGLVTEAAAGHATAASTQAIARIWETVRPVSIPHPKVKERKGCFAPPQAADALKVLLAPPSNIDPKLKAALDNELRQLNSLEELSVELQFASGIGSNAQSTPADPSAGLAPTITIGNDLIQDLGKTLHGDDLTEAAKWILAHEYGHQVQYKIYGPDAFDKYPLATLEMQADSLAGLWMFHGFVEAIDESLDLAAFNKGIQLRLSSSQGLAGAIFTVGDGLWNAVHDHGTAEQRRVLSENGEWQWAAMASSLYAVAARKKADYVAAHPGDPKPKAVLGWRLEHLFEWTFMQVSVVQTLVPSKGFRNPENLLRNYLKPAVLDGDIRIEPGKEPSVSPISGT